LTVPDENTTAILISADHVTVDLNGFAIIGPNTCTVTSTAPTVVNCSATGSGSGIEGVIGFAPENLAVFNGTIRGMGNSGVRFFFGRVERVRVISNGAFGIELPVGAAVGGPSAGSIISGNWAVRNGFIGINAGERAAVSGNVASFNGDGGISTGEASTVSGNTVNANGVFGISTDGTVRGDTITNNGDFGLFLSSGGYTDNVIIGNLGGTVSGGVEMGTNVCDGTTTCP
jgi:hypothetical protein